MPLGLLALTSTYSLTKNAFTISYEKGNDDQRVSNFHGLWLVGSRCLLE
jgi:hypothetical protein